MQRLGFCWFSPRIFLFVIAMVCFPKIARGDLISVSTAVMPATGNPTCGDSGNGSTSASASFNCTFNGQPFSGSADAQAGIGPFGIGAIWDLSASGSDISGDRSVTLANISWSQEFILEGATGAGVFEPGFNYSLASTCFDGGCNLGISMFGQQLLVDFQGNPPTHPASGYPGNVAVTFNVPFTVTVSGMEECTSHDQIACGQTYLELSDFLATDASGTPLSGISLVAVP